MIIINLDKIIKSKRKNILIVAGAGCGKTYTIVKRVRYLINYLCFVLSTKTNLVCPEDVGGTL